MWFLLAILSGSFAAVLAVITKLYLKNINAFLVTFLFSLISLLILGTLDILTKQVDCRSITMLSLKEWMILIIASILNALGWICYVSALKCGRAGCVVAIDRLGIIYVLLLSAIFLRETFSFKMAIGAISMVFGAVLMSIQ